MKTFNQYLTEVDAINSLSPQGTTALQNNQGNNQRSPSSIPTSF